MYCPSGPNSRICAAVLPWAGPALDPPRENTKTWPLEFTATPAASPRCRSGGSLRKFGTDSYGIKGAGCPALPSSWAKAGEASATSAATIHRVMRHLPSFYGSGGELSGWGSQVRGGGCALQRCQNRCPPSSYPDFGKAPPSFATISTRAALTREP